MKQKLTLFILALFTAMGMWADTTVTIVDGTHDPYDYFGTRNNSVTPNTLTTNATSGLAGVVLTAPVIDKGTYWSTRCMSIKNSVANTDEDVTFTAPTGYLIKSISMTVQAISSNNSYDVTVYGETTRVTGASAKDYFISVNASSFSFTINSVSGTVNWLAVKSMSVTLCAENDLDSWMPSINGAYLSVGEKVSSFSPVTDPADNSKWYILTQVRGGESPMYNLGTGQTLKRAAASFNMASLNNSTASYYAAYLIRFVAAGEGTYNIQFANGDWINSSLQSGSKSNAGTYAFYNTNSGSGSFFAWNLNSNTGSIVDNNGAGNTLAFWSSGTVSGTSGNNVWYLYETTVEVPASFVNVTYNFVVGGNTVNTMVVQAPANSAVAIPVGLTDGYSSDYYTFTPTGTIGNEDCTITVTGTLNNIDIVYPYTGLSNSKSYYIYSRNGARGGLSTYTDGDDTYLAISIKDGLNVSPKKFAIISYENRYYLYSVDDAKFVTYDGSNNFKAALADCVTGTTDAITFSATTAPLYELRFDNNSNKIFNGSNSQSYPYGMVFNNWGATSNQWDDGCQYTIEEADDFNATAALAALEEVFHPSYTVTYIVKDVNNNTIFTSDPVGTTLGAHITTLPAAYQRAFCSYNEVDVTISAVNTDVVFTATYSLPFTLSSDFSSATWYNLNIRSTKYVHKAGSEPYGNNASATIIDKAEDAYRWAFAGNPYALQLWNKDSGNGYTLTKEGENVVMRSGTYTWTLCQNSDGFTLKETNSDYTYVHDLGGSLKVWTSSAAPTDNGSTFRVEALVDNYASNVAAEIKPWFDNYGSYFQLKTSVVEANQTKYEAALVNCDLATYEDLLDLIADANNYVYPSTGFYRIKSSGQRIGESYIAYGQPTAATPGLITVTAANAPTDASTILKLTGADGQYTIATQGMYAQNQNTNNVAFPMTTNAADAATFSFIPYTPGVAVITNDGTNQGYFHEAGWAVPAVVRWTAAADASHWTIEDVETLTVPLNGPVDGSYYATLCVPFDVTLDGATAYTLNLNAAKTALTMTEVESTVAAGTPVLLKGASASATASISTPSSTAISTETALTGTYVAKTVAGGTDYFLGVADDVVGFYHWDGTTLSANRAYLEASKLNSNVKGFALDFEDDATGINEELRMKNEESSIYNLAGQRMNKMQKGINIINGKKILK